MIHTSFYRPIVIPVNGINTKSDIDRLQDLSASVALNRSKIKEIGRDGIVDWRIQIPTINVTLKQLEYGNIAFWNSLTNATANNQVVVLNDFKLSQVDLAGYKTDDSGTFLGTIWYPNLRVAGFEFDIGDPMAISERSFSLVGEDEIFWQNNNKYLIYFTDSGATTGPYSITIGAGSYANYPLPVLDPDTSATYLLKIIRVRSGTSTLLVQGTDYTYNSGTHVLNFSAAVSGDTYKVWYTATTYITSQTPFVNNDTDMAGLPAEQTSIYLATSQYVYRLQSVKVSVKFDRTDLKEIGNTEVVSRGVKNKTVNITLGRTLETFTVEEILRGKLGASWGKLNPRQFQDNIKLIVKTYDSAKKTTFKLGYSATNLAPISLDGSVPLNDYATRGVQLEGEDLTITNIEASL